MPKVTIVKMWQGSRETLCLGQVARKQLEALVADYLFQNRDCSAGYRFVGLKSFLVEKAIRQLHEKRFGTRRLDKASFARQHRRRRPGGGGKSLRSEPMSANRNAWNR